MIEHVVAEIWREIKRYVNPGDRAEAADTVLSVMIDHDCDIDDILTAFVGDIEMKEALTAHLDDDIEVDDDDYDDVEYDENQDC